MYIPPRPLLNHGIHRCKLSYHYKLQIGPKSKRPKKLNEVDFFDVIALSEPLDSAFVQSNPTREAVAQIIQGKVLAWGRWTGECERKWT